MGSAMPAPVTLVTCPLAVIRPIVLSPPVNQTAPSGPVVMPSGARMSAR